MKLNLYNALEKQYQADIEKAKTNILVYLERGGGVAEHDDTIESIDKLIEDIKYCIDSGVERMTDIIYAKQIGLNKRKTT